MKKKLVASVVAAVLVSGAGAAWWSYWPIYQIREHVKSALNDPDSAQFFDIQLFPQTGGACGFVNAKNKMGGYVGKTQFSVTQAGEVRLRPNVDRDAGTPQEQIIASETVIAFLKFAVQNCSDEKEIERSSAPSQPVSSPRRVR